MGSSFMRSHTTSGPLLTGGFYKLVIDVFTKKYCHQLNRNLFILKMHVDCKVPELGRRPKPQKYDGTCKGVYVCLYHDYAAIRLYRLSYNLEQTYLV